MTTSKPDTSKPRRYYTGVFTDTRNWDNFEPRAGDVFICVPPKSGTTWMQSICGLLIFGDPEAEIAYPEISPWVDFSFSSKPIETRLELLAAQTHQRFIKSHSPVDGVPFYEDCTYIVGHRHPLDVHYSMRNHVHNMRLTMLDHLYTDDTDADFEAFLEGDIEGEGFDQPSLAFLIHHMKTAQSMAHLPNVHLFHYNTMSANLTGQMQRVAKAIGVSHPPDLFEQLVGKATFKSMKANAHLTAPGAKGGLYKDATSFFESGKGRKWEGRLSDSQIAAYNAKMAAALTPKDVRYYETGEA